MLALVPLIVLLAAWAAASRAESMTDSLKSVMLVLPFIIAVLAMFMSLWYQNSSSFFIVLFILISSILIRVSAAKDAMLIEAVTQVAILLPVNVIWLAFITERGIISSYGANKAIIVAVESVWILVSMLSRSGSVADYAPSPDGIVRLPAPAIVLSILAIGLLIVSFIFKNQHLHLVFIAVLISVYISLYFAHRPVIFAIFTASAFIMIVTAMFEVSYSLAFYDTLTGVLSRRALEQELVKLGSRYAIAMVDIDHFKRINDTYGHDVGDEVLKMVASVVDKVSGRAKVFRYGGEEFAIIFPGFGVTEALPALERVRKAVERRPFILRAEDRPKKKPERITGNSKGKGRVNITVSIGAAERTESAKTAHDVIIKADEALYKAKCSGRNRVSS